MNWKKIFYYQISIYYIIIIFASTNLNVEANSIKESSDESIEEIVEMVSSADEISDIFMGTDSLLPDSQANLSSTYTTRRIILMGHLLEEYKGAEKIILYPAYKETILSFPSEKDTEEAYKDLLNIYGEDACFVDKIISSQDILMEGEDNSPEENQSLGNQTEESLKYHATSWGVSDMGMESLKSSYQFYASALSQDIKVAVLDTGINVLNDMFSGRKIQGYNTVLDTEEYGDISSVHRGHGTHVCGIISDGTPECVNLLVVGVFDAQGNTSNLALLTAFQYALEHGADIINMSLGYKSTEYNFLDEVINIAYEKGIPVIAASGNEQINVAGIYPASNERTLAISGLMQSESDSEASVSFDSSCSGYGYGIDFCAPGTGINSAANEPGDATTVKKGTSMAVAHISALCAWLKMLDPSMSVEKMYDILLHYSQDLGTGGKDMYYGNGYPRVSSLLEDYLRPEKPDQGETDRPEPERKEDRTPSNVNPPTASSSLPTPKKTKICYIRRKTARSVKIRWKKVAGVTGYQICYSISGSFRKGNRYKWVRSKGQTSCVIKKLKKNKRYYFRIRTYRKIRGKKKFSSWSKKRKMKMRG